MDVEKNIKSMVIPAYQQRRDFYHSQEYFQHARKAFFDIVERERPESILDVGCGHGIGANTLMGLTRYVGIDPIEQNLVNARKDNPGGEFHVGFMQETGMENASFDWVLLSTVWDILPSLGEMEAGIKECLRVARKRIYSIECQATPRFMVERCMMIPPIFGLSIERVNYNPAKCKNDYLWCIDKLGIKSPE